MSNMRVGSSFGGVRVAAIVLLVLALLTALVAWLNLRGEADLGSEAAQDATSLAADPALVERGAYLARAGNCAACHTARGGAAFAGGMGIDTPFGTVYASNLTPDRAQGIGDWTAAQFWRAMHHGRSRDGRLLYPVFPYPSYSQVTRADSDAIYAFLRSQAPVAQANKPHALRFPYNLQASLAVWRALFFRAQPFEADSSKSAAWNRGAYLVRGLGHCAACHAPRNALGAISERPELSGGLIPMQNWYAPSLSAADEAGVGNWPLDEIARLLKTGVAAHGGTLGPMAEVVFRSTQHLDDADLLAIATFLKDLPQAAPDASGNATTKTASNAPASMMSYGATLYTEHCARCHGEQGEGRAPVYRSLAGNRKVTMRSPANLIRIIVSGGFAPTTAGNPRPFGMPPFGQSMTDAQIAALATYVRNSWGNAAAPVSTIEVLNIR